MLGVVGCDVEEGRPPTAFVIQDGEVRHGKFFIGDNVEELSYEVVDGRAIHQGDILLGEADELEPWEVGEDVQFSAVAPDYTWPGGVVPYMFEAGINEKARGAFLEAVSDYHELTNVTLVERTDQDDYILVSSSNEGCYATLGYRNRGEQSLNLGPRCETKGIALHEIGHSLGLFHEQSRADRDDHIEIDWDAIEDGKDSNFEKYEKTGRGEDVGPYDFASIMHYRATAFGIDDAITIRAKEGDPTLGQRERLSTGDLGGIARLYGPVGQHVACSIVLESGDYLRRGETRSSCNGTYTLMLSEEGDIELRKDGSTYAAGEVSAGEFLVMSKSGALTVYDEKGNSLWQTRTDGNPETYAALEDNGNLVLFSPTGAVLWQSGPAKG